MSSAMLPATVNTTHTTSVSASFINVLETSSSNPIHIDTTTFRNDALSMIIPCLDTSNTTEFVNSSHLHTKTTPLSFVGSGHVKAGSLIVFYPTIIHRGVSAGRARPSAWFFAGWLPPRNTPRLAVPHGVIAYETSNYDNTAILKI